MFTSPGMSLELGDNEYGCSSKIALLELEYIRQWLCEAAAMRGNLESFNLVTQLWLSLEWGHM